MRNAFAAEITELAAGNKRIVLLSGDIGNRLFNPFKDQFPDRFYNCGVAEADMVGIAAGMALSGLRPFTYTITPFMTFRCLEQIKIDVCYQGVPVVIVGVGGGLSYAELGATHQSCEDIGMLRMLPGMTVLCPADPVEVRLAVRKSVEHDGPVYLRLGKKNDQVIHKSEPDFVIGRALDIRPGTDVCLLSTGNMMPVVLDAAALLEQRHISCRVVSFHTVKPLDAELLEQVFADFKIVATVEEHSLIGGFGAAVAEWLADHPARKAHLVRIGTRDTFCHEAGRQAHARKVFGLTPEAIFDNVLKSLSQNS